jgi:hypothetical protein
MYDRITAKNTTGGQTFGMVVQGLSDVYRSFTEILGAMRVEIINFGSHMDVQWYDLGAGLMEALIDGLRSGMPTLDGALRDIYATLGSMGSAPSLAPAGGGGGWNYSPTFNNFGGSADPRETLNAAYALYKMGRR